MLNKVLVMMFSGRAGVGKTTSAKYILKYMESKNDNTAQIYSFASGLKQVAKVAFGWDGVKNKKGRILLQDVGNTGRKYNEDIWVNMMLSYYEKNFYPDVILIDDWRFPNEYEKIKNNFIYHPVTIRLEAPNREILKDQPLYVYNDISEVSLPYGWGEDADYYDYVIDNQTTMDDLEEDLRVIFETELENLKYIKER